MFFEVFGPSSLSSVLFAKSSQRLKLRSAGVVDFELGRPTKNRIESLVIHNVNFSHQTRERTRQGSQETSQRFRTSPWRPSLHHITKHELVDDCVFGAQTGEDVRILSDVLKPPSVLMYPTQLRLRKNPRLNSGCFSGMYMTEDRIAATLSSHSLESFSWS